MDWRRASNRLTSSEEYKVKDKWRKDCNSIKAHTKALGKVYEGFDIQKCEVSSDKMSWDMQFPGYAPPNFTTKQILEDKPVWADPDITDTEGFQKIKFNQLDGKMNRFSFVKDYRLVEGLPQNPIGRTGISGRGSLGKWGPNHAADPIVTRWKRNPITKMKEKMPDGSRILEFVGIQRRDTKEWAIPGGMVDADEEVSQALKRKFGEVLNTLEEDQKEEMRKNIEKVFKSGDIIYKGYLDSPRNTDNAWVETVVSNFHDDTGKTVGKIPLFAGDDAQAVRWITIDGPLELTASHAFFIEQVCARRKAFFAKK